MTLDTEFNNDCSSTWHINILCFQKLDEESKYLNAFYCVMCLMCASITLISPDADSEIPDTKHDLFRKLSLESLTDSSSSN